MADQMYNFGVARDAESNLGMTAVKLEMMLLDLGTKVSKAQSSWQDDGQTTFSTHQTNWNNNAGTLLAILRDIQTALGITTDKKIQMCSQVNRILAG